MVDERYMHAGLIPMAWTLFNGGNVRTIAFALVATGMATAARGDEPADGLDAWFDFLAGVNTAGLMEPAGSHGSIGISLAAGAATYQAPEAGSVAATLLDRDRDEGAYVVPRVWLVKGLPWPVDVGVTAGSDATRSFSQVSGFAQWTVYEELARPALTLRAGYGALSGMPGTEIRSASAEAVASYGFLRYLNVYAAGGMARHAARIEATEDEPRTMALKDGENEVRVERDWLTPLERIGLRITALPPFVAITVEAQRLTDGRRAAAAKIAVGM
jgi:hypothetical protein